MGNATYSKLIHTPVFNAALPHWNDMRKYTSQTLTLLSNINSSIARHDMTDRGHVVQIDWLQCLHWRRNTWIKFYTQVPWGVSFQCCMWNFLVYGCTRSATCMFIIQGNFVAFLLWHHLQENSLEHLKQSFTIYNQLIEYAALISVLFTVSFIFGTHITWWKFLMFDATAEG